MCGCVYSVLHKPHASSPSRFNMFIVCNATNQDVRPSRRILSTRLRYSNDRSFTTNRSLYEKIASILTLTVDQLSNAFTWKKLEHSAVLHAISIAGAESAVVKPEFWSNDDKLLFEALEMHLNNLRLQCEHVGAPTPPILQKLLRGVQRKLCANVVTSKDSAFLFRPYVDATGGFKRAARSKRSRKQATKHAASTAVSSWPRRNTHMLFIYFCAQNGRIAK